MMAGGERRFHTAEQMAFLDKWILKSADGCCVDALGLFCIFLVKINYIYIE